MTDKKDRQQNSEVENRPEEFEEQTQTPRSEVDDIIEVYKEEAHRRDTTPCATIYKYDNEKSGQDRVFSGYFKGDEIPNRHTIGLLFGSGRYKIYLDQPKGNAKTREQTNLTFRIHAIYDIYKAKADAEKQKKELAIFTGGSPDNGQLQTGQSFQMVKEILSMILPVLKEANRNNAPQQQAPRQETQADLIGSYTMMQKLLKNNLFDTAETFKQYHRKYSQLAISDLSNDDEEDPEINKKEPSVVEKIISMIEPFFGLIAQKTTAGRMAAAGLKAAPQFLEILQDPALCRMIVSYFDKTRGIEQSDIALKNIGIDRQQLFRKIAGTQTNEPKKAQTAENDQKPGKK